MLFGAAWPASLASIIRDKAANAQMIRKIGLEGHRFTPNEALQAGLVDYLSPENTEEVLKKAQEVADNVCDRAKMGVWGLIRVNSTILLRWLGSMLMNISLQQSDMYAETIRIVCSDNQPIGSKSAALDDAAAKARL